MRVVVEGEDLLELWVGGVLEDLGVDNVALGGLDLGAAKVLDLAEGYDGRRLLGLEGAVFLGGVTGSATPGRSSQRDLGVTQLTDLLTLLLTLPPSV